MDELSTQLDIYNAVADVPLLLGGGYLVPMTGWSIY